MMPSASGPSRTASCRTVFKLLKKFLRQNIILQYLIFRTNEFEHRAHHLNQRFVESTKNPTIVKTQFIDSVRCGKNFQHKNCLYNLGFEVRWNLIQIPT